MRGPGRILIPDEDLARARAVHHPGSITPHTMVLLPSYSMASSVLRHYAARLLAMEHRHLVSLLMLARVPGARVIFVTSSRPERSVLDYYLTLVPPDRRASMRARTHVLEVPDASPRSVTAKLLDRPDLLARLRRMTRGDFAWIEPWNVTPLEMQVAERLQLPLNGTPPQLWPLGHKSSGRRLMRRAGVPLPVGHEDVRTVDEVVAAAEDLRRRCRGAAGVVVKTDDGAGGLGNRVIRFDGGAAGIRAAAESLDPSYLADLARGGVVEELVEGPGRTCPSVQVEIAPHGHVEVVSTHEQVLGGPEAQDYLGCEFPAHADYGPALTAYGAAVGEVLAGLGVVGRFGVDFVAVSSPSGGWTLRGVEINLRKCGTTHPLSLLENLAPGHYDLLTGQWLTAQGATRAYLSTDNLLDPRWLGRPTLDVIGGLNAAGLGFEPGAQIGVVLHSLCGLASEGRLGLTAIGHSPPHARRIYRAAVAALDTSGGGHPRARPDCENRSSPC